MVVEDGTGIEQITLRPERLEILISGAGGDERMVLFPPEPAEVKLLSGARGVPVLVGGPLSVPVGEVTQIRFVLAEATIASGNVETPLFLTSTDETGLKVIPRGETPWPIREGESTRILVRFSERDQLVVNPVRTLLRPTISGELFTAPSVSDLLTPDERVVHTSSRLFPESDVVLVRAVAVDPENGTIREVAMLPDGTPTTLAAARAVEDAAMRALFGNLEPSLGRRLEALAGDAVVSVEVVHLFEKPPTFDIAAAAGDPAGARAARRVLVEAAVAAGRSALLQRLEGQPGVLSVDPTSGRPVLVVRATKSAVLSLLRDDPDILRVHDAEIPIAPLALVADDDLNTWALQGLTPAGIDRIEIPPFPFVDPIPGEGVIVSIIEGGAGRIHPEHPFIPVAAFTGPVLACGDFGCPSSPGDVCQAGCCVTADADGDGVDEEHCTNSHATAVATMVGTFVLTELVPFQPAIATFVGAPGRTLLHAACALNDPGCIGQSIDWSVDPIQNLVGMANIINLSTSTTDLACGLGTLGGARTLDVDIEQYRFTVTKASGNNDLAPCAAPPRSADVVDCDAYNTICVGGYGMGPGRTPDFCDDDVPRGSWENLPDLFGDREEPDVAAPYGVDVYTDDENMGFPMVRETGTSMSAPGVAGMVANMMDAEPMLTVSPHAVRAILMAGATHNIPGTPPIPKVNDGVDDADGAGVPDGVRIGGILTDGTWYHQSPATLGVDFDTDPTAPFLSTTFTIPNVLALTNVIRVALTWGSCTHAGATPDISEVRANLDLELLDPAGNVVATSLSLDNNFEMILFNAEDAGDHEIRVRWTSWDECCPALQPGCSWGFDVDLAVAWVKYTTFVSNLCDDAPAP